MLERIKTEWRAPVPPVIKFIAMGAVVVTTLTITPNLVPGPVSTTTWVVSLVVGALTVAVVLTIWRVMVRIRTGGS